MNQEFFARYEYKYAVNPADLEAMRRQIAPYCRPDEYGLAENRGFYTIDSLYLDTPDYRFYWNSENRSPYRLKLRVRTYPDAANRIAKFEIKRRVQDLVVKSSTVLPQENWQHWLRKPGNAGGPALDEFLSLQRAMNAGPKMLVRYSRLAFRGVVDHNVRITFDRRMVCQPMPRYELDGAPRGWSPIDDAGSVGEKCGLVLELKFKHRPPVWMADLVRQFGLVRQGYSKYGCAVRRAACDATQWWDLRTLMEPLGRNEEHF
jgi:hypothetical protein